MGDVSSPPLLKAKGSDSLQPPTTGWQVLKDGEYKEDASLTCTNQPEHPCCRITVSLSGEAKEGPSYSEGKYRDTGLTSMGRQVFTVYMYNVHLREVSLKDRLFVTCQ